MPLQTELAECAQEESGYGQVCCGSLVALKVGASRLLHALVTELLAHSCMLGAGRHCSERRRQMLREQQKLAGHSSEQSWELTKMPFGQAPASRFDTCQMP